MKTSVQQLRTILLKKGYRFFENGTYNLNIIGVRSRFSKSNNFDDLLLVVYKNELLQWVIEQYSITTDPGKPWLINPIVDRGTAVLCPGQYAGAYAIGIHGRSHKGGGYQALEQVKPMRYVRDNNRDAVIDFSLYADPSLVYSENPKTNIHHAGSTWFSKAKLKYLVNKNSAGCQVFEYMDHFEAFMKVCKYAAAIHGNSFTYTLLEETDF